MPAAYAKKYPFRAVMPGKGRMTDGMDYLPQQHLQPPSTLAMWQMRSTTLLE